MFLILVRASCSSSSAFAPRRHTIFNGNDAAWRNTGVRSGTPHSSVLTVWASYFRTGNGKHLIRWLTSNFRLSCCWKPAAYLRLVSVELFNGRIGIASIARRVLQCPYISMIFFLEYRDCWPQYIYRRTNSQNISLPNETMQYWKFRSSP